ncbi:MAG: hypothetical protein ABI885_20925 [Gammaproteobacteria bacterium]
MALQVTVDGSPAQALGVMSQGGLHSLAISLFLPRAPLAGSLFRFIAIDPDAGQDASFVAASCGGSVPDRFPGLVALFRSGNTTRIARRSMAAVAKSFSRHIEPPPE